MKKFAVLIILAIVIVLVAGSCNKNDCPAYSKISTVQTNKNV